MIKIYCSFIIFFLILVNVFRQCFWQQSIKHSANKRRSFSKLKLNSIAVLIILFISNLYPQANFWETRELESFGGYIGSISFNSNNDVFLSTYGSYKSGIIRSVNHGKDWNKITNGLTSGWVWMVRFNSNNQGFAATEDGIFRSDDNGENWTKLSSSPSAHSIVISKDNIIFISNDVSVYCSTDNGVNWKEVFHNNFYYDTPDLLKINALAINFHGHIFVSIQGKGIFRSTDQGNKWINIGPTTRYIKSILSTSTGVLVVATQQGIYRSFDNGDNWDSPNTISSNILTLAFNKDGQIFAGTFGDGVFRSTDNGESWIQMTNGLIASQSRYIRKIAIDYDDKIFVATDNDLDFMLFSSTDNGENWIQNINCFNNKTVKSLVLDSDNSIIAGTSNGIYKSTDDGLNWFEKNKGISSSSVNQVIISKNGNIFTSTGLYILRSTDHAETWAYKSNGLPTYKTIESLASNRENYIFAADLHYGIYRSSNEGENWMQIHNGLPLDTVNNSIMACFAFNSISKIFAVTSLGDNYESLDNGDNWVKMNLSLTSDLVTAFALNSQGHLYAGTANGKVLESADNGESWLQKDILTIFRINGLAVNSNDELFAYASDGVYRSVNDGASWIQINSGLINKYVLSFLINKSGYAFAGISQGGVYRSSVSTTSIIENINPQDYSLSQNYPNPFNPTTIIGYSIPKASFVTLKVYDILGREIATLVNAEKSFGNYNVEFNGSGLSSGIYFYKLQTGDYSSVKKMVLIK